MSDLKHTKIGIISFVLAIIVLIFFSFIYLQDVFFPISFSEVETSQIRILIDKIGVKREMSMMITISFITFIFGMAAMIEKGSKKTLPKISIVISGIFIIPMIIGLARGIFIRFIM